MRTFVHVDGFNLYYGALRGTPWKWLDLTALFAKVLQPRHDILKVKYFTARVSGTPADQSKPQRQDVYLRALLRYRAEVEVYYGHFLTHRVRARLARLVGSQRTAEIVRTEEKGSAVNLAVHLLNDGWLEAYDCAVVVSNDSDIAEAMRLVKEHHGKRIGLVTPGARRASHQLAAHADFTRRIRPGAVRSSQLPDPIPGTNMLKLYVKEAFNREGIPAPDERISTWADCREDLARNEFGILRSAVSSSSLVMKDGVATLAAGTEADQTVWFADFDRWQKGAFWEEMRASAVSLGKTGAEEVASLGGRILAVLDAAGATPQASAFVSLMAVARDVRNLVERMKKVTDGKIRGGLNLQVNRDRQFLDDMATFIESLAELGDDPDDQDAEDEEEANLPRVGRAGAVGRYVRKPEHVRESGAFPSRALPDVWSNG